MVQAWRNTHGALVAVRQGHDAIVSPTSHAYFDYDVSQLDLAQVYSFDPLPPELVGRRSDSGASTGGRVLGGEMNLWTEYVPQERVYAKLLPRATAMAECLWTSPTRRDFPAFLSRWYDHRQRLAALGYVSGPADRPLIVTATATDRHGAFRIAFQPHDEIRRALDGTPMSLQTAELDPQAVPDFVPGGLPENLTVAETVWNPMPDEDAPLHLNLPDGTRRLVLARLLVMDRPYGAPALVELSHHVALNRPVAFGAAPSSRFPTQQPIDQGGGLTDGLHGSWNFRDGHWAGFEGTDLEARVDLGDPRSLRDVSIRFIQDANAWVWLPQTVEVLTSIDGTTWRSAGQVDNRISDRIQDKFIETFTVAVTAEPVAWVRVVARNRRTCPDWHPGAGQPCWLFADELVCRQ